jgi:stringent starvation protein B
MIDVKTLLKNYLDEGKILIIVDSQVEGVKLPDHLMNLVDVRINLSYHFNTRIFEIDDEKVVIDLGFNGVRFECVFPFESIWYVALVEDVHNGVQIVENTPIEMLEAQYLLDQADAKKRELENKQIDFLTSIPKIKASEIEKRLPTDEPKKPSSKSRKTSKASIDKEHEDKLFDDFMKLVASYEVAKSPLSELAKKSQRRATTPKPITPKDNSIRFSNYSKEEGQLVQKGKKNDPKK